MKIRDLIAHLESLATPDGDVFAQGEDGVPFLLLGGYTGETSRNERYVVLASRSLTSQEGGF
ncbi:hypothetical protein [Brevundimonas sp. UBA7664]|uniref:hypothetical protein n=1 Tax=Brevundimonas sp. UBA7664 TaxID=1946141 RepID=UPI0025C61E91|nr:hypothetical protein [Brevundimonas sp. UBA7664]